MYSLKRPPELVLLSKKRYGIFPKFQHVHQTIPHLGGFADLNHYPFSFFTPFLIRVSTVVFVHGVGTCRRQWEHLLGVAFVRMNRMIQFPRRQNLSFCNPFPIRAVMGIVCFHVHFQVTQRKRAIFKNVGGKLITSKSGFILPA
jgi:hypothetical protein